MQTFWLVSARLLDCLLACLFVGWLVCLRCGWSGGGRVGVYICLFMSESGSSWRCGLPNVSLHTYIPAYLPFQLSFCIFAALSSLFGTVSVILYISFLLLSFIYEGVPCGGRCAIHLVTHPPTCRGSVANLVIYSVHTQCFFIFYKKTIRYSFRP